MAEIGFIQLRSGRPRIDVEASLAEMEERKLRAQTGLSQVEASLAEMERRRKLRAACQTLSD
jgi:hypothetical protein